MLGSKSRVCVKYIHGLSLNLLLNCVLVGTCALKLRKLRESLPQFLQRSVVVGVEVGEARRIAVGERKCRGRLDLSSKCLLMVGT